MLEVATLNQLYVLAANYLWLAEAGPIKCRSAFEPRRDALLAEYARRDRMDIVEAIREKWSATIESPSFARDRRPST